MTTNAHGRSSDTSITIGEPKAPTHAERARTLVSEANTGTLCTLTEEGYPYGSYVTFALESADPVFLISRIAAHTQNLEREKRASLLVHEDGATDPLSNGRVTLVGLAAQLEDDAAAREAFLEVHPQSAYYVDFIDFSFWRLAVESVRYIGGYGRMSWVKLEAWRDADLDPIAPHAEGIITHMNDDHADALVAYARAFTRATDAEEVAMTGVDRYGFELSVAIDGGRRPARIAFDDPVMTPTDARKTLIAMLADARAKLGR